MRNKTKKLIVAVGLILGISQISLAQNATIAVTPTFDNPTTNVFEVGITRTIVCTVTDLPPKNNGITSYTWTAPKIGPNLSPLLNGHIQLGVAGTLNQTNLFNDITETTTNSTSTVNVSYGDLFNPIPADDITCKINYLDSNNANQDFTIHQNVVIKRICTPTFNVSSIPSCSTTPFSITAAACDGDLFTWTVSNGVIQGAQNTNTISIQPNATGSVNVSCKAGRNESMAIYNYTGTKSITRIAPPIPTINTNVTDFCIGNSYPLSIATSNTGILSTTWSCTGSATFSPTIGSATTLTPAVNNISGSTITVNAFSTYTGGCTTTATKSFHVWSTGMVLPAGTFNWVPNTTNQCNIGVVLNFTPSNSVNGTVYCDECGGHTYIDWYNQCPNLGPTKYILVTVQYVNPCSVSPAKVFSIAAWKPYCCKGLPAPLKMHQQQETLKIYPNPAKESINIDLPIATNGSYVLVDINGREVMAGNFDEADNITMVFPPLNDGLYILNIHTASNNYKEKLIIKN